ncbi:hypothetical protein A2U01_0092208, partial [Trifolium medium]|nr:hypothetical protein [Trifolium medium]
VGVANWLLANCRRDRVLLLGLVVTPPGGLFRQRGMLYMVVAVFG